MVLTIGVISAGVDVEETVNRSEATSDGIVAPRGVAADVLAAALPRETVTFVEPDWEKPPPPPHPQSRVAAVSRARTESAPLRFMEIPPGIAIV